MRSSRAVASASTMSGHSARRSFAEDWQAPSPIRCVRATYREINNFYTPTVYEKGAELIRMLRLIIGQDAFRRGMDLYFARCGRHGRDNRGFSGLLC